MSRRMVDPQTIIKSQVINDKNEVDLHELLEKYGTEGYDTIKSVTLQIYSKEGTGDNSMTIITENSLAGIKGCIMVNTAITISKDDENTVYISGSLVESLGTMKLITYIEISDGDYENGIRLVDSYRFDVHVIKV